MKQTNKMIYSLVPKYKNVRLASWRVASHGHRNYFTSDGVHLTPAGGKVFARIIRQALSTP
jgi:lysophospholipase L1-like esterase